jgi:hypothetical protein
MQGFFKDSFEVEDVLLDYNEQLFWNVRVYEEEWWMIITLNSLKFDVGCQCTNSCFWRYLRLCTFEDWIGEYFGVNSFVILLYVKVLLVFFSLYVANILSFICKVCFLVFVLGLLL